MNKNRKKYDNKRVSAIKWTAERFDVSEQYVRAIDINSSITSGRADDIRKAYRKKYEELKKVLS